MNDPQPRPFCEGSKELRETFDRWVARLAEAEVELTDADRVLIGVVASREVRLEALGRELRREKDSGRRLRVIAAERLAAQDMSKALDQLVRTFGAAAAEEETVAARGTGTDGGRVLSFEARPQGLGRLAQRIVAALGKRPLTKAQIRRLVSGSRSDFARGLQEAVDSGSVVRSGSGRKGRPFVYAGR
jgi:hypothetical protein